MATENLPDQVSQVNAIYFLRNNSGPITIPMNEEGILYKNNIISF
jgi:hypothetical protein